MRYKLLLFKRFIEDIGMYPLILLGRLIASNRPLQKEYKKFYFFPFYHTGGAEKVHALIAKETGSSDCIIFFTRKSHNNGFLHLFKESGCDIRDVSAYTDNKWIYFANIIFRGIISGYINSQKMAPAVFNGQSNFGYKVSPWIKKTIPQIELIHSVSNFSYIRIPFLPFIRRTIMISTIKIREHLAIYRRYGVPAEMDNRIQFIMNAIDLPAQKIMPQQKPASFTVLYVGRGTPEKRVGLIAEVASLIKKKEPAINFQFLGEVKNDIPEAFHSHCHFWGNQGDSKLIESIYNKAHVLILLSDTEGFPMVVMEAMANGLAIVATAVGELPLHIRDEVNGFLIQDYMNEKKVMEAATAYILRLYNDRQLLHNIAAFNVNYAYEHFGMDRFGNEYRQLFNDMQLKETR